MPHPVLLRDGTLALIRHVEPRDEDTLLALHEGVSATSRYLRFMGASRRAVPGEVARLVRPRSDDHVSLLLEEAGQVLGVGGFERLPDEGDAARAEVAFLVADDQQGRGVATLLFEQLAIDARDRGVNELLAEVLTSNHPMLHVVADLGYSARTTTRSGVCEIRIDLTPSDEFDDVAELRHRGAELKSLERLLNPRSVALVGASARKDKVGGATLANILAAGYGGPIYAVNPGRSSVQGLPAYASLRDLPGPVDLVVFAVPARTVVDLMDDCRAAGARSAVVLSSGFADAGETGRRLQAELLDAARSAGVRLVGPNCLGLVTATDQGVLAATFAPRVPRRGGVGVLTQSGGMAISLIEHARRAGLGLSNLVSVGNKVDVSGNDMLAWWLNDAATDVCVLYLESFGNPRRFSRLARELSARKPVVVVKAGTSTVGGRAAASHTAAGVSPRRSVNALLRQAGVIQVEHVGELVEVVTLLATAPLPAGNRLAVLSNAGGTGILAADAAAEYGLEMPALSDAVRSQLKDVLPDAAGLGNPVDTTPGVSTGAFVRAAELLAASPDVDALVVGLTPTPLTDIDAIMDALGAADLPADKPVVLVALEGVSTVRRLVPELVPHQSDLPAQRAAAGLPVFAFPEAAVRSLARVAEYAEHRRQPRQLAPAPDRIDARAARRVLRRAQQVRTDGGWLGPETAADLLSTYGIETLRLAPVASADEAVAAATRVGWPVVLKAIGAGLVHKSDLGGVALGIASERDLRSAYETMRRRLGERMTGAGVQATAGPGVELILGVTADDSFGPLVMCGLGGIWSDVLDDREYRLTPLSPGGAATMLRQLKCFPLLQGYRGTPPADIAAVEDLLMRVAALAHDNPEVRDIDLNPVIVHATGLSVVDVKVRVG